MKNKDKNKKSIKINFKMIDICIFVLTIAVVINLITTLPYFTLYRYFENKNIDQSTAQTNLWRGSLIEVLTSDSIEDNTKREFASSLTSISEIQNSKTRVVIYIIGAYHILLSLAIGATGIVILFKKFKFKAIAIGLIFSGVCGLAFTIFTIINAIQSFIF